MALAFDTLTLARAIMAANDFLGDPNTWNVQPGEKSLAQTRALRLIGEAMPDTNKFSELQAYADNDPAVINKKLEEAGIPIRLADLERGNDAFYVAAILKLTLLWLTQGNNAPEFSSQFDGKPVYRLNVTDQNVSFYELGGRVVLEIPSQNPGDVLYVTQDMDHEHDVLSLGESGRAFLYLMSRMAKPIYDFGGVILPNIMVEVEPDISFMEGLWKVVTNKSQAGRWRVKEAKAYIKFLLNRFGAKTVSAVAMSYLRESIEHPDYVAAHDLYIVKARKGSETPVVTLSVPMSDFASEEVDLNS